MTSATPARKVNLAKVFQNVASVMAQNETALNEADTLNHDHGTNMAQTFRTIAGAVQERKTSSASAQLEHASAAVRSSSKSGSAQLYADGLHEAAMRFKGRQVTEQNAMELVQTLMGLDSPAAQAAAPADASRAGGADMLGSLLGGLMGGGEPAQQQQQPAGGDMLGSLLGGLMGGGAPAQQQQQPAGGDMLGSLLGGLMGGGEPAQQQQQPAGGGDMLGSLLGGLMGGGAPAQQQQQPAVGGDMLGSLLGALSGGTPATQQQTQSGGGDMLGSLLGGMLSGAATPQQQPQAQAQSGKGLNLMKIVQLVMVYLQAKQTGQSPLAALAMALLNSGSPLTNKDYRAQSGALVMQSLLQSFTAAAPAK
ncbi:MAG TPA: DAK2 domain-containing protein [Anaerolineaceae bacterium]|nr:DAK2 domain-containing protein [Anaerolineaceae bacterium]